MNKSVANKIVVFSIYSIFCIYYYGIDDTDSTIHSRKSENRYTCSSEGCEEGFETSQERNRHTKYACGKEKEHECEICKKRFILRGALLKHQRQCFLHSNNNNTSEA